MEKQIYFNNEILQNIVPNYKTTKNSCFSVYVQIIVSRYLL